MPVIIIFISMLSLALAFILILVSSPATAYELSIYSAFTPITWVLLFSSVTGGIWILVHQAFNESKNNLWLTGFLILLLATLLVFSLPSIRGYYLYGGNDP